MMRWLLLCMALGSTGALRQVDKTCDATEECLNQSQCLGFQRDRQHFSTLQSGSAERSTALQALKGKLCNKALKGVCCECGAGEDCVAQEECPAFLGAKAELRSFTRGSQAYKEALTSLRKSICNKKPPRVCCQPGPPPTTRRPSPSTRKPSPPGDGCSPAQGSCLPGFGQCGISSAGEQRIFGGKDTRPGELPFTALLGQKRKKKDCRSGVFPCPVLDLKVWTCGGTLINQWYVLTAAHCHHPTSKRKQIGLVRLGEYEVTDNDQQDCLPEDAGGYCLPKLQDFNISPDDVMLHEGYARKLEGKITNTINDIALIRLPRPAQLNDGVAVACLPILPSLTATLLGVPDIREGLASYYATVVGWGFTKGDPFEWKLGGTENRVAQDLQQKLGVPVLDDETCSEKFFEFVPRPDQLCAGGELGKDSCSGDSGGPLYMKYIIPGQKVTAEFDSSGTKPWYQLGIVSFGTSRCGTGSPGIYTRVESFVPWIQGIIRD